MDPLTMSGMDPGQESGLISILQQIQQQQNAPLVPNNPASQIGSILSAGASGLLGRPDPVMNLLADQRNRQMQGLSQQAVIMNHLATLNETRRLRDVQENDSRRKDLLDTMKFQVGLANDMLKNENATIRENGYEMLKRIPANLGGIDPKADSRRLAMSSGPDFNNRYDAAITDITSGLDPMHPMFQGQFEGVPLDYLKQAIQADPMVANRLRKKPIDENQFLKTELPALLRRIPEADRTPLQVQTLAALAQEPKPVNYGQDFNAMGRAMSKDPKFGAFDPNNPSPEQADAIIARLQEAKPGTLERLNQLIFNEMEKGPLADTKQINKWLAQKAVLKQDQADIAGGRTEATQAKLPYPAEVQKDMEAYSGVINKVNQLQTFTPEQIQKFTGSLQRMKGRTSLAIQGAADAVGAGGLVPETIKPDPEFARFQSLMGELQQSLFALGGKQLTGIELRVAAMSVPTGSELGGAQEMLAKAKYLKAFMQASRSARQTLATTGKGSIDLDQLDNMIEAQMKRSGYGVPTAEDPTPWMKGVKTEPPSGYRRKGE